MDNASNDSATMQTFYVNLKNKIIAHSGSVRKFADNMSQDKGNGLAGVSSQTIKNWTNENNSGHPGIFNIHKLAGILGCSIDSLFESNDTSSKIISLLTEQKEDCEFDVLLENMFGKGTGYQYKSTDNTFYNEMLEQFKSKALHVYFTPLTTDKNINIKHRESGIDIKNVPYGIITFCKDCSHHKVFLDLHVDSGYKKLIPPRKFEGFFVVSQPNKSVYFLLYEIKSDPTRKSAEVLFLSFREDMLSHGEFKCALAVAVSTYSELNRHYPTAHRVLISSKQFSDEFVTNLIWPFLELNSNRIYIEKDRVEKIMQEKRYASSQSIMGEFEKIGDTTFSIYKIRDEFTKKILEMKDVANDIDKFLLLKDLRIEDMGFDANKIGGSADELVRYIFDNEKDIEELMWKENNEK